MRWFWATLSLAVAGCNSSAPEQNASVAHELSPDIGLSRVPGVSMSYAYGFRLPADRIIAVQEEHAAHCEALTPSKCRITGMTYDVVGNRSISASLEFKLAPEIARAFGKQGIDLTVKRGGMLSSARIESEDSGETAAAADRDVAAADAERAQLTEQLARPGLPAAERTALQKRLADLADRKQAVRAAGDEARLKLASTPMQFTYASGEIATGLQDGPFVAAMKDGWANVVRGVAIIISLLISISPWVVTGLLLLLACRWGAAFVRRRFPPQKD